VDLFEQLQAWHWFVFAVILFVLELLITTGFFLGMALAALVLAGVLFVVNGIAWSWQLLWFGVLSVALTLAYRRFFRQVNAATDNPLLNNRAAQLIGKSFVLGVDLDRNGADMLGDTRWTLRCAGRIKKGSRVRVVDVDGMVLRVEEDT
jgi:membrane protein implicated in regulation of membrane protease activity